MYLFNHNTHFQFQYCLNVIALTVDDKVSKKAKADVDCENKPSETGQDLCWAMNSCGNGGNRVEMTGKIVPISGNEQPKNWLPLDCHDLVMTKQRVQEHERKLKQLSNAIKSVSTRLDSSSNQRLLR